MSEAANRTGSRSSNRRRAGRSGSSGSLVLVCALVTAGLALGAALGLIAGFAEAAVQTSGSGSGAGSGDGGGGVAAPTARDDSYDTREDRRLSVGAPGVLKNDYGKRLSAHKVSSPRHGTLDLDRDGSFLYRPDRNYNGPDSFSYEARNGKDDRATVRIGVKAVNDAPNARNDGFDVLEDGALRVGEPGVLRNDTDVERNRLSARLVSGPRNGTLNLDRDGSFLYTPAADHDGGDSFVYRATDGHGGADKARASISITPVNDEPSFTKGADQTVDEDSGAQSVSGWATNISAGPASESGQSLTFQVTNNTNPALFSAGPSVSANGTLTYTPAADANGQATITVRLKDDGGTANGGDDTSDGQQFGITVDAINDGPRVSATNDGPVDEGESATITATATDPDTADGSFSYSFDCDDDGTFEVGPQTSNTTDCSFDDDGAKTVNARVTEGSGGEDTGSTTVTVNNVAPTGMLRDTGPVNEGSPVQVSFEDTDGRLTVQDPSSADRAAGFRYEYQCDGSFAGDPAPDYDTASTDPNGTCTPTQNGTLTIAARAIDKDDGATAYTTDVNVNNVAPDFTAPTDQSADEGENKTFGLGSFTDPGADGPWTVTVDWGDNSTDTVFTAGSPGALDQRSHTYADNGAYTVTVTVAEAGAGTPPSDSGMFSVTVSNVAPTVTLSGDATANEGQTKTYTYTVTDPGDDPTPTVTESCGTGATKTDTAAANSFDCTFPDGDGAGGTAYDVTVSANDGADSGDDTKTVTVANLAPTADGQALTIDEDETKAITLSGSDPAGASDPLTFKITSLPTNGKLYEGNSTAANDEITSADIPLTLSGAQVTYVPDADYSGPDSFGFEACDDSNLCDGATVGITLGAVNDAPVVDLNGASGGIDSTANFLEAGGPVTLTPDAVVSDVDDVNIRSAEITLTNRPDGNAESLSVDTSGTSITASSYDSSTGVLTLTGSASKADYRQVLRTVEYDNSAAPPDAASRTVEFTVNDGDADSAVATVTITVTRLNEAPVVDLNGASGGIDSTASFTEDGGPVALASGAVVSDADDTELVSAEITLTNRPDGNAESLSVDTSGTSIGASSYDSSTGVISLSGSHSLADYQQVLRTVKYANTSNTPDTTDRTVQFTVNDSQDDSSAATSTVSIAAADDPSVANDDTAIRAEDSGASAIDVRANDTDPDSASVENIQSVTQPDNGTVVITGGGTGLTYQPNANYCNSPPGTGSDTFTYTLVGGSTATVSVTVTCSDDDPVAVNDSVTKTEDSGATAIDALANDTDIDGGPKTISLASDPANGTVTLTGGTTGAHTGLTYQPNANYCNTQAGGNPDTFTYKLNGGSQATVSVTVTCVDDPPVAVNDSATVLEDAAATSVSVLTNDTDIDGGPKTISSVTQPDNGTVVITGGGTGLTYQPAPNYCNDPPGTSPDTFTYKLNGDSEATVSMTVTCVNDAPVAVTDSFETFGNTELRVDLSPSSTPHATETTANSNGALNNDTNRGAPDESGQTLTVGGIVGCNDATSPYDCTVNGARVVMQNEGRFSYTPAPGAASPGTFQYVLKDDGGTANGGQDSANGTVNLTLYEKIWYVDPAAGTGGNGTSSSPYNALSPLNDASDPDGANDYVFVHDGTLNNVTIELEAGQRLLGEGVGLSINRSLNGNGAPTNLVAAGTKPQLNGAANVDTVRATLARPAEIRGLSLSGGTGANALDMTAIGAPNGSPDLEVSDNTVTGAGLEGMDFNLGITGATSLSIHDNAITSTGNALDVNRTAGSVAITRFDDNVVSGDTGGSGIVMSDPVTFDANTTTAGLQQVSGGATTIGAPGNRVGASGMTLTNVTGDLAFSDLDVYASGGALQVTGTGQLNAGAGTGTKVSVTPASSGGTSTLDASGGPGASVDGATADLQLSDFESAGSAGSGLLLTNVNGTFSAPGGSSITNAGTIDVSISGGNADVTYGGTITDDVGGLVNITNTTGGTKDFNGAITDGNDGDGGGISMSSNTGATVRFDGGLTLSTGSSNAFSATSGGTVAVTDPAATDNTIATTTGTALNVQNTTIGTSDLTFRSINTTTSSNNAGVILINTGSLGGLTVTGTGTANSGGTISNKTGGNVQSGSPPVPNGTTDGVGFYLSNTAQVSLTSMNLQNFSNNPIFGFAVTDFTLASSSVSGSNGDSDGFEDGSVFFTDGAGTYTISNSDLSGGRNENLSVLYSGATARTATYNVTGTTFRDLTGSGGGGGNAQVKLISRETASTSSNVAFNFTNSTFENDARTLPPGGTENWSDGILTTFAGSFQHALTVQNSTFHHLFQGLDIASQQSADVNYIFKNNNITFTEGVAAIAMGTGSDTTSSALITALIQGNTIGTSGVAQSGSRLGLGIILDMRGNENAQVTMHQNTIRRTELNGIQVIGQIGDGDTALQITNNLVDEIEDNAGGGFGVVYGIEVTTNSGGSYDVCLDAQDNNSFNINAHDIRVRQATANNTFQLEGFGGNGTVAAQVESFLATENPGNTTNVRTGGSVVNYTAGSCNTPAPLP